MSIFEKTLSVFGISSLFFGAAFAGNQRGHDCDDCKKLPKFSFEFSESVNAQGVFNGELHQGNYVTRNSEGERIDFGTYYSYVIKKEECNDMSEVTISRLFGHCGVVKATLIHNPDNREEDQVKFSWGHGIYECWSHSCIAKSGEKGDCNACHDHSWWKFRLVEDVKKEKWEEKKDCRKSEPRKGDCCWKDKEEGHNDKWCRSEKSWDKCDKSWDKSDKSWDKCDKDDCKHSEKSDSDRNDCKKERRYHR